MRIVGLVGGIGSGKSEAASILSSMGAEVIDADKVGHAIYAPGTPGFRAVVETFGPEVVGPDGHVDRKMLGALVFADPAELRRLNAVVHPLIRREIELRIAAARERATSPLVVVEAAILLEAGWQSLVDEVWVVTASPETVRARLAQSRGLSADEVAARVARQMSDRERRAAADEIVENDGDVDDLRGRLQALWAGTIAR